ncbi:Spx/MgsR family RNA polymerase-binding regulatory protein [Lactococcus garvieae]|uniref:Spx/MgsR family RNA polymerase-binding regulatory protein n=1 Tax=Lactococcus garvieae TaxID=1363 RepID=UPI003853CA39
MIHFYYSSSCNSCNKAKSWLDYHHLKYIKHNLVTEKITKEEILDLFAKTENGTSDVLSKTSLKIPGTRRDLEELSLNELAGVLSDNPKLIRRPLITEGGLLQVGFNEEQLRIFIPRESRKIRFNMLKSTSAKE